MVSNKKMASTSRLVGWTSHGVEGTEDEEATNYDIAKMVQNHQEGCRVRQRPVDRVALW